MDTKSKSLKQVMEQKRSMKTKSLIATADLMLHEQQQLQQSIKSSFATLAEQAETTPSVLMESVTHVLANIATKLETGQEIDLMHINSVAAFLAGVDVIANALPQTSDQNKRTLTIDVLSKVGLDEYGKINDHTFPIVNVGARNQSLHKKYAEMLKQYTVSAARGAPQGEQAAREVRRLQMNIDKAMRSSSSTPSMARTGPSSPGNSPRG